MTIKQKLFLKHYLPSMGVGAEAARRAGYSVRSAKEIAYKNLQREPIKVEVEALLRSVGLD
jgi:phage terminase small subunit